MGLKPAYRAGLIGAGIAFVFLMAIVAGCSSPASDSPTPLGPITATPSQAPSATPVTPSATLSVLPTTTPSPTPTPTPSPSPTPVVNGISKSFQWVYKGKLHQFQMTIPQTVADYYMSMPRSQTDYGVYAITSQNRQYLPSATLTSSVQSEGFGEFDAVSLVQAFVLSLQDTSGRDGSPKYPVETLLDGGGDSEDTSILAAALLNDMGYNAVLLELPGHMAVGVKATEDLSGWHYSYNGADYFYLETAMTGYQFGTVPDEYRNVSTTIYPMSGTAVVSATATYQQASEEQASVYYKVSCVVTNSGADTAKGVTVVFTSLALIYSADQEWAMSHQEVSVGDLAAGESRTVEATVKVPRSGDTQLECIVSGDNFGSVVWKGDKFTL